MMENDPIFVLVAPLDWGLGHATRCIPIINELIQQGARVVVAANPAQNTLLKSEFPRIEYIEAPGYNIRYKTGILLKWGLLFRLPSLLKQIKRENIWLNDIVQQHHIDAVISDNRYGLYHRTITSVFITHQLQIQSGIGSPNGRVAGRWPWPVGLTGNSYSGIMHALGNSRPAGYRIWMANYQSRDNSPTPPDRCPFP
ncbi:MAG: hypothetical protein WDM78_21425 [Puia sp.]